MNFKSFDEILRKYLEKKEAENEKEKDNDWWYASELGLCKRKHFLRRLGIPASNIKEFRIKYIAEDGKAGHEWREKAAEELGILLEKEGSLKDEELRYSGRFDLIAKIRNKPVLIDIKTQRPEAFFRRERQPIGKKVKDFHKMQLASYVYFAKRKYPELEESRVYYVDRGGGLRNEYIFHFRTPMFEKMLKELQELNQCWEARKLPNITDQKWECKQCPYHTICMAAVRGDLTVDKIIEIYDSKKTKQGDQLG